MEKFVSRCEQNWQSHQKLPFEDVLICKMRFAISKHTARIQERGIDQILIIDVSEEGRQPSNIAFYITLCHVNRFLKEWLAMLQVWSVWIFVLRVLKIYTLRLKIGPKRKKTCNVLYCILSFYLSFFLTIYCFIVLYIIMLVTLSFVVLFCCSIFFCSICRSVYCCIVLSAISFALLLFLVLSVVHSLGWLFYLILSFLLSLYHSICCSVGCSFILCCSNVLAIILSVYSLVCLSFYHQHPINALTFLAGYKSRHWGETFSKR